MLRRFSINFAVFSIVMDAILIAGALWTATIIRPAMSKLSFAAFIPPPLSTPLIVYVIFPVLWVLILIQFSVYDGRKNLRLSNEVGRISLASLLALVALAGTLYLSFRDISRLLFFTFVLLAYLLLLTWRLIYWGVFQSHFSDMLTRRKVLIVGAGILGQGLADQIKLFQRFGLQIAGFLDDDHQKQSQDGQILGDIDCAKQVVRENDIDDVIIALPARSYEKIQHLVAELHNLPVKVWLIPDYFHLALHKAVVEEFAGIAMLDLRAPALTEYQRLIKRSFDLLISLLILPIFLPLMGLIAIAIRLEGPGPIVLRQKRIGENGRMFEMLKFRTMVPNAEKLRYLVEHLDENGRFLHKSVKDPRVTKVGRFLRRTSLDEIPQIFNVLLGQMSLVGPRPELPYLVDRYESWQRKRFTVPQGVTGWWQINGRSDKPMHLHTEDDLYYVQHYSLLLDIQILLKTVWVVLRGNGAY